MPGSQTRWKFWFSVMLPVIAAVSFTVAAAALMVTATKERLARSQAEQVLRWDVLDVFTSGRPDINDVDDYFGADEFDTYGHDLVAVLDPALAPIYVAREGEQEDVAVYDLLAEAANRLAVGFRTPQMRAAIAAYENGDSDTLPQVTTITKAGGRAAMLTVLPIVSNWEGQEQKSYYFHVALRYLDADLTSAIMAQYPLAKLHFDTVAPALPTETVLPLSNDAGRFVAYAKWMPERPGTTLLRDALPAALGLLGVISAVIGALLYGLRRSTQALETARAEALHRATHDPLTGLANRALFNERLERSPLPLTLLALDLDRFKAVNDTMGHEAGDALLKQVAGRLVPLVDNNGLVARLGGDEFMILLSGPVAAGDVEKLAGRVVEELSKPFRLGAETAQIGVSVGIARADNDERADLVARADFALYDAKESGRNTYRLFEQVARAA